MSKQGDEQEADEWETEPTSEEPEVSSDDGEDLLAEDAEAAFLAAVTIDAGRPDAEFMALPALVWKYGCALSRATATWLQAKRTYDHVTAALYCRISAELDADPSVNASKITVKRIEAAVRATDEWVKARADYDRALSRKALAAARLDALQTKQNALQSFAASRRVEAKLSQTSLES